MRLPCDHDESRRIKRAAPRRIVRFARRPSGGENSPCAETCWCRSGNKAGRVYRVCRSLDNVKCAGGWRQNYGGMQGGEIRESGLLKRT